MKLAVTVASQMTMRLREIMKEKQRVQEQYYIPSIIPKKIVEYFAVFKPNNLFIMKKVLIVIVLFMAVLAINAQATKTTGTKEKGVRTTVMVADLQKPITDAIAKDYVGYTIKEATTVTENNIVTFEVVVVKGTATEVLVFDKEGIFVKKLPPVPKK